MLRFLRYGAGIGVVLILGLIAGTLAIRSARAESPAEWSLACTPKPAGCVLGEMVMVPRDVVIHNAKVIDAMQARIVELEKRDERVRSGALPGCI